MRIAVSFSVVLLGLSLFPSPSPAAEPKTAAEAVALGDSLREKKDWDAAVAAYTKALKLNPKCAKAYCGRGRSYGNKGEIDKAFADLNDAIRLDPQDVLAYNAARSLPGRERNSR